MSNLLKKITDDVSLSLHKQHVPLSQQVLYFFTWIIVILAFATAAFLLVSDVVTTHLSHMPLSAAPLLLIGTAYLAFQILIRAQFLDLFKALIVSCAFILWGVDQLLPSGWFATTLGDIVIVLYIIDLGWMMVDRLKQQWQSLYAQSGSPSMSGNSGRGVTLRAHACQRECFSGRVRTQGDAPTRVSNVSHRRVETVPLPVLDKNMPLLVSHIAATDRQYISQRSAASSTGSASSLKRHRLTPLACTCTSPLSPLQSPECCCQMKEAVGR